MKQKESRVIHIEIQEYNNFSPNQSKQQLFKPTPNSTFSRKNTCNNWHPNTNSTERMHKTGSSFFKKKSSNFNQKTSSEQKRTQSCSAIFNKPIIKQLSPMNSCFDFGSHNSSPSKSQTQQRTLYSKIVQHNQKLISKVFFLEGEIQDLAFKKQGRPKNHYAFFRFEQYKKKKEIKEWKNKQGEYHSKNKNWKIRQKGFHCIIAHKKMNQLEKKCEVDPWEAHPEIEDADY